MNGKALAVCLVVLALGIIYTVNDYNANVYTLDRVNGELSRAKTSGNIEGILRHLKSAREILEPYHGNPAWMFSTDFTNLDYIKEDLTHSIEYLEEKKEDYTSIDLDVVKDSCLTFIEQIDSCQSWMFWYKPLNWLIWAFVVIIGFISGVIGLS